MVYSLPGSFGSKSFSTPRQTPGFGSTPRFSKTGYEKFGDAPGPGSYSLRRPLSASATRFSGPSSQRTPRKDSRVDFGPRGEGAEHVYSVRSSFDRARASSSQRRSSFGSTPRFSRTGYEKFTEGPGPAAYAWQNALSVGRQASMSHSMNNGSTSRPRTPGRERDRLNFGPQGEGAEMVYTHRSTFERAASPSRSRSSALGSTPRFSSTGYEKFKDAPGPGAYTTTHVNAIGSQRSFSRPSSSPPRLSARERDRLNFAPTGEGAEMVYSYRSSFERALSPTRTRAGFGQTERFAPTGYEKFKDAPGPGAYRAPSEISSVVPRPRSAPLMRPSSRQEERLDFGKTGEGAEMMYSYRSTFERAASPSKARTPRTPRFAPTGYEKFKDAPGPGAYNTTKTQMVRPQPAPFGSTDRLGVARELYRSFHGTNSSSVDASMERFRASRH